MSSTEFAQQWATALGSDTEAFAALYAEDEFFSIDQHMMDDHMGDTLTTKADILEQLGPIASGDHGTFTFTVKEYRGDARYGLVIWDLTVEGAETYRGIPTEGKSLKTDGSSFLQFDDSGKITLESTCFNDNPIFAELGIPIFNPHYWVEGFDPASLGA